MMKTFYQFLYSEATPPSSGGPQAKGPVSPTPSGTPASPASGPVGAPAPAGAPVGLGGPPLGMGGPGPAPSLGGPMGDPMAQPPQAGGNSVVVKNIKSSDVWKALENSLKSKKSRQEQ